jgi:uncharacterized repeat protein (TIGR01451 family)
VWGEEGSDWGIRLIPYWFESGSVTVDLNSNVSIHKTVSDNDETNVQTNTAENNEQITYTINVSNSEARAENVRVVDDYNENFLTILDADGGNDNGDTITWNISELAHGENRTYTIQAQIVDLEQGDYTFRNNAWTENPSEGPVWAETIVNPRANISIDKVVSDSDEDSVKVNAVQGDHYDSDERLVRFDITYANDGDADAHNVILTDDLSQFQSEGVIVSVDNISNGGVYDSSTGLITWNIGDLPDGESGSQSFDLQLERIGNGDRGIVNTTTIDTEQTSPINSTTTTNILTPEYTIEKTDNTDNATTGDSLTYQLTLSNTGTGDGYNIVVEDILPDYIESVDNISNGGVYDSSTDTIVWEETTDSGISLDSGESRVFSFDVTIPDIMPVGSTVLTNRATIDSPTEEAKEDTDDTVVEAQPELDIEKYVRNLTAISEGRSNSGENADSEYGADADSWYNNNNDVVTIAGDEIQYTLVYRNTGNANSPDTFVADHLPRYILDGDGNQYEIIREEDFLNIDNNVTPIENGNGWDIVWDIGTLEVDSEWIITQFTVRINPSSTVTLSQEATDRLIDNTSEIYSDNDQVLSDTDNAVIRVDQPNAEIVKESDKVIYQSNEEVIYEITVSNNGSSTATGIVRDTLPTDMHYISSNPDVTHQDGQLLEWEVTLGVGESTTIVITAGFDIPVEDQQFFDNQVLYDYTDINSNERPDVEDNVEVQVLAPVIEVEKEKIEADVVTPLNTIKYIVKMRNVGSGTAYGINIKDTIDVELVEVLEDTISHDGTWDAENQIITWDMGELEAGEEIERSFTARVKFGEEINDGDQIENSVTIENDTTATIESNVVTSEINCGYLAGTIWEDENKNAIIDEGELRIPNAEIDVTVEDFEKYGATFESNDSGQYVATCLPYERNVDVDIIRPTGYIGQTTVDNYRVRLSMSGDTEIYELDEEGNTLLVWAGSSFEHADLGLYRDRLASGSVLGVSTMAMSSTGIPTILALLGTTGLALGLYFGIREREKMKKRLKKVLSFDTIKNIWN